MSMLATKKLYSMIKDKIINFGFLPGQILMVQQLASDFEVSRTPVREALVRLKEEGFVEETTGRKFKVTEITWTQICDLYAARKLLESYALKTVGNDISKEQLAAFESINRDMQENYNTKDFSSFFENDSLFHSAIIDLCDNNVIKNWMKLIRDHQQRIRYLTLGIDARLKESLVEHKMIVDNMKGNNIKQAVKVLNDHLDAVLDDIHKFRNESHQISSVVIK